jgi:acyl-CoA synthetase (AMP-forming)/AMP-acid ligase II
VFDFTPYPMPVALRRRMGAIGLTSDECVGLSLTRTADRFPNQPAIVDLTSPVGPVTYAELLDRVLQFAGYLRSCGVTSGDVIVIQAPNSLGVLVAWLAAWQCGCICAPVIEIYHSHECGTCSAPLARRSS